MDLDCSDEALHLCFREQRPKFLFLNPVVPAAIGFAVVALHFVSVPSPTGSLIPERLSPAEQQMPHSECHKDRFHFQEHRHRKKHSRFFYERFNLLRYKSCLTYWNTFGFSLIGTAIIEA